MKYMLLVYGAETAWTEESREECMKESTDLCHHLKAHNQYVDASPLHSVTTATSVRIREGKRMVTDGPFAETTEQLAGYFLIDVDDLDEAIWIAGRIPGAKVGTVEIRPVVVLENLPV